ncbi:MAG TPA: hypothetical protein GXZ48_08135 [Acholeplasmataceae bacterium]|jgi:BclB C-terminal domain-containing protein|nr:hypothetical protein [Acholeplasmataceae bacterium]
MDKDDLECKPDPKCKRGPRGPRGPQGLPGTGAVIPFASGLPVTLETGALNSARTVGLIGFGNSVSVDTLAGGLIDLSTNANGALRNMAFSLPRDGTITGITAFFSTADEVDLPADVTINALLYISTGTDNVSNNIFIIIWNMPGLLIKPGIFLCKQELINNWNNVKVR